MLLKSFKSSFQMPLNGFLMLYEVFLYRIGRKDDAREFTNVTSLDVSKRLRAADSWYPEDTDRSFAEYIRMTDGEAYLSRFYAEFKDWDPKHLIRFYMDADHVKEALMRHFMKHFRFQGSKRLTTMEKDEIYNLFKKHQTFDWTAAYMGRDLIGLLANSMSSYFISNPERVEEIAAILNKSGLNVVEEKNGEEYSAGQFTSVSAKLPKKRRNLDDMDFAEISKQIYGASVKNQCEAFFHGKSNPYPFYDIFSYLKWRDICEYERMILDGVPQEMMYVSPKMSEGSRELRKLNAGIRTVTYVRSHDDEKKYVKHMLNSESATKKIAARHAGLDQLYNYFTGKLDRVSLADLSGLVTQEERLAGDKDTVVVTEAVLAPQYKIPSRIWQQYFTAFQAAFTLYTALKENGKNIFDVDCSVFAVPVLVGRFEKLSDYVRYAKQNMDLVLGQVNPCGEADNDDAFNAMIMAYRDAYVEEYKDPLDFAKHIPLKRLISVFYEEEKPVKEIPEAFLGEDRKFNMRQIEKLMTVIGMVLNVNLLGNVMQLQNPTVVAGSAWNSKQFQHCYRELSSYMGENADYSLGVYVRNESVMQGLRGQVDVLGCGRVLDVLLSTNKSLTATSFMQMDGYEQIMCLTRVYSFFYNVRLQLLGIVNAVRTAKVEMELYTIWQNNRAFLELLNNPSDVRLLDNWYGDLRLRYATYAVMQTEVLEAFRDLLKWFVAEERAGALVGDIMAMLRVLNAALEKFAAADSVTVVKDVQLSRELEKVSAMVVQVALDVGRTGGTRFVGNVDAATGLLTDSYGRIRRDVQDGYAYYYHSSGARVRYNLRTQTAELEARNENHRQ